MTTSRRTFLRRGLAAAGAVTGFYTWRIEPHWVEFVARPLPVINLPPALSGKRLVQLSDVHVGPHVDDDYVLGVFDRVRALAPDIVVYTGDFTSWEPDIVPHARRIYAHAPRGAMATLGIFGNHDYGPGWRYPEYAAALVAPLAEGGIRTLRNESVDVAGLDIIGLDDWWSKQFRPAEALAHRDRQKPAIVLSHNPDTADLPGWFGYEGWILAGHTHGGQCKAPFFDPPFLPVRNRRYTAGEFDLGDGRRLYINRGLGYHRRVRFNVRPEITAFTLRRTA
ncbi:MAG: metallophosphoesterase [Catenulispora sp.]